MALSRSDACISSARPTCFGVEDAELDEDFAEQLAPRFLLREQGVDLRIGQQAEGARDFAERPILAALHRVDLRGLRGGQPAAGLGQFTEQRIRCALRVERGEQLVLVDQAFLEQELAEEFHRHEGSSGAGAGGCISGCRVGTVCQATASRSTRSIVSVSMGFCR